MGRDIFDPQISPNGKLIAYVSEGQLRYVDENGNDHAVTRPKIGEKSFGVAEFIAAEEMGRRAGHRRWTDEIHMIRGAGKRSSAHERRKRDDQRR